MNRKCKPNFFIAGMPRSGTTSMYTYLKQHPDIFLSIYKEPNFFGKDLTQSVINIRDEELYYSLFDRAGNKKRIGEGSVWYLTSQTAAAGIKQFSPAAKIIVMLRDPVEMIYSLHALYIRTGNEDTADFQKALEIQPDRMKGLYIPKACYFPEGLFYTEVAKYYDKIKRFIDVFGRENIHFVIFDDFAGNTARSYRDTLEFLGVDAGFRAEFDLRKAAAIIRPVVFEQLRHALPEIKRMVGRKTGKDSHAGPSRPPMSVELRRHLKNLFKEDIEKTGRLTGRNLAHWSR